MPEIPLTQYMMPDGKRTTVHAPVSQETFDLYWEMKPILSCEVLTSGQVAIYGRLPFWEEDDELIKVASNGPENSPTKNLEALIKELEEKR